MTLARGDDIKGWEGVTQDLGISPEEKRSWVISTTGLIVALIFVGLITIMLSGSGVPTLAKAILIILLFLATLVLLSGTYSAQVKRARAKEARREAMQARVSAPEAAPVMEAANPVSPVVAVPEPTPAPVTPAPVMVEPVAAPVEASAPVEVGEGTRPEALSAARDGIGDDLTLIKGVGPALKALCNRLGFYHFDQIAGWTASEVAWVDHNLEGFKGRVSRDDWVSQAKILAAGGQTEFSARQDS